MRCRKRIEEIFGWGKIIGGLAQLKVRGLDKVKAVFTFGLVAYNLVRLPKLLQPRGEMCLATGKWPEMKAKSAAIDRLRRQSRPKITPRAGNCGRATRFSAAR